MGCRQVVVVLWNASMTDEFWTASWRVSAYQVLDPGSDTAQQEEGTSATRRATTTGEGGSPPGRHASRRRGTVTLMDRFWFLKCQHDEDREQTPPTREVLAFEHRVAALAYFLFVPNPNPNPNPNLNLTLTFPRVTLP